MTREEAKRIAQGLITDFKCESQTMVEFCNVVIEALGQQPKTGHWVRQTDDYHDYYECEYCGIAVGLDDIKNYCPNCGARMIEPQESEG